MTWNYRMFNQKGSTKVFDKKGNNIPVPSFMFIAECYYDDDGAPEMHSNMDHNIMCGDEPKDLKSVYKLIGEAFTSPIIELDEEGNFA